MSLQDIEVPSEELLEESLEELLEESLEESLEEVLEESLEEPPEESLDESLEDPLIRDQSLATEFVQSYARVRLKKIESEKRVI